MFGKKKNHILYVKFAIKMLIYRLNQDSQLASVQNTSSLHHNCFNCELLELY